ncbi:hypothetical protein ACOBQB_13420 [Streptomyces sp. G5(2025)]|uniref:hypothetical protein n=1 Tax=Streptomyces sp. G5(2025) TaxID=3406628 RepID=UPI003C136E36
MATETRIITATRAAIGMVADTDDPPRGEEKERLCERLDSYRKVTDARCEKLRAQLMAAEDFAATLRRRLGDGN